MFTMICFSLTGCHRFPRCCWQSWISWTQCKYYSQYQTLFVCRLSAFLLLPSELLSFHRRVTPAVLVLLAPPAKMVQRVSAVMLALQDEQEMLDYVDRQAYRERKESLERKGKL